MDNKQLSFIPKIYFPANIYFGSKSLLFFKTVTNKKKVFVISKTFKEKNEELLKEIIDTSSIYLQTNEPTTDDLDKLKDFLISKNAEYIVGIGGGSVIDLVKAAKNDLKLKMIAISTTIGAGSEVSQFVVLTDKNNFKKKVIASQNLLPEIVIINSNFLKTLSYEQVLTQSIDALAHAIESLTSRMSNFFSDSLALIALENVYNNLLNIQDMQQDNGLLEKLKMSGILAGLAQSSSGTGLAHSFAHYFGVKNKIPHAKAVSIFLLDVLELNAKSSDKYKKLNILKNISDKNFITKFNTLFEKLNLHFEKLILKENILVISEQIRKDICTTTNPYLPKVEEIEGIIKKHI